MQKDALRLTMVQLIFYKVCLIMNFTRTRLFAALFGAVFAAATISTASAALSRAPQDNLFFASSTDPLGLDPALVDDNDSGKITSNIYESLLRFEDDNTNVAPSLAESWTVSDDGLSYTFKLRQGVKFHDGTPFNAEAVKFNIDRQMPENAIPKMSYAGLVYGDVEKSEVIDEYTIKITLKKKSTPFLHNLAMSYAAPIVSPTALKTYNNNVNEHPTGTGPYKFVAWDRGQQVILTRNDEYWGKPAHVQNLIYRTMPETSARVVALNNGEVDIINGIDANVIDQVKQGGNQIFARDGMNTQYMFFNVKPENKSVTMDKAVRRAIAAAINVPEMVQSLYKGYASPAETFLPDFIPGYSDKVKHVPYNPEEAKKVLAEKGVKKLTILTYSGARLYNTVGGQVLAEAVQGYLDKAGVQADVLVYDWATFKNKLITDSWDIGFMGWNGDNGDPDNFLSLLASDDPINNNGMWFNQEYRDLLAKGLEVQDGPERNAIYERAEQIIAEEVPILPISHAQFLAAMRPNIKNFTIHPVGMTFLSKTSKE